MRSVDCRFFGGESFDGLPALTLSENLTGRADGGTRLFLGWTQEALYARFEVTDAEIVAGYSGYNDPLYEEDAVELFVSADGSATFYQEFEFNPNSAVFHGCVENCRGTTLYLKPQTQAECRSQTVAGGWVCDVKLPFSLFRLAPSLPPLEGDCWLFNAFRVDCDRGRNVSLYALNPTLSGTFHDPGRFIGLKFIR